MNNQEFGSDFHYMDNWISNEINNTFVGIYPSAAYFANGRQALLAAIKLGGYRRIWIPVYFCYEVVEYLLHAGVNVVYYNDYPTQNDKNIISNLSFSKDDVLLRVNYFGWRAFRDNTNIPIHVIEDHSHDLIGHWAYNSNADWCIASLRKTIPIPEGGALWSPKGHEIKQLCSTYENDLCTEKRLLAMKLKRDYLKGAEIDKRIYREIFMSTEAEIGLLGMSGMSRTSKYILNTFNIKEWYRSKKYNWMFIYENQLLPMNLSGVESCNSTPFSIILSFMSIEHRENCRKNLIDKNVYPALLWQLPSNCVVFRDAISFSDHMLSIHCDGRYNLEDMKELSKLVLKSI